MTDADCDHLDHAVLLRVHPPGGRCVLSPAEAEQLSADLLRASAAARAFRPAVGDGVQRRVAAAKVTRERRRRTGS